MHVINTFILLGASQVQQTFSKELQRKKFENQS